MPKSDIEIAQAAKMERISKVALDKLGIADEHLVPYGHYKAKLTLEFIDSLKNKPNGKLILVTAINPTPAGEGKTTTTVGLGDALNHIGKKAIIACASPPWARCSGSRAAPPAAAMPRWCRWKTSTCILPAIFRPSPWPTTCWPRRSTTTSTTATN